MWELAGKSFGNFMFQGDGVGGGGGNFFFFSHSVYCFLVPPYCNAILFNSFEFTEYDEPSHFKVPWCLSVDLLRSKTTHNMHMKLDRFMIKRKKSECRTNEKQDGGKTCLKGSG